jgi:secondary thiamine-phosphate synthase enzyme
MTTTSTLRVSTPGRGFTDVTREVARLVEKAGHDAGICLVFCRHTSASLLVSENADPDVRRDLEAFFARLVKDGDPLFRHDAEGPDDMPSHVRAALTQTSVALPIVGGRLALGTWQAIYLWEHRHASHARELLVTITG